MQKQKLAIFRQRVIEILDDYLGPDYLLFVFGSQIRGNAVRSSDIDMAVYRAAAIPAQVIIEVKSALEEEAGTLRDIDLVNLTDGRLNSRFLANILEEGKIWKKAKNSKELLSVLKRRLINSEK